MTGEMHIYGQTEWHGNAFIVGDTKALKELRDTIDQVLKTGCPAKFESMVNDGEGYWTCVVRLPMFYGDLDKEDVKCHTMDDMAVPYTNEIAAEKNSAKWPEILVKLSLVPVCGLEDEMRIIEEGESVTPTAKKWSPEKIDAFIELVRKS